MAYARRIKRSAAARVQVESAIVGSEELFSAIRAALALSGSNLSRYCEERGVDRSWAYLVLKGRKDGKKSRELRKKIVAELLA